MLVEVSLSAVYELGALTVQAGVGVTVGVLVGTGTLVGAAVDVGVETAPVGVAVGFAGQVNG